LSAALIEAVFQAAQEHGAALLAVPVAETIKRSDDGRFTGETVPRAGLYLAQTPQVFERILLARAYAQRSRVEGNVTDDCQLVEALGHPVALVMGSALNIKITTQLDLKLAAAILPLLEKPRRETSCHPFENEQMMWGNLPKLKPSDVFGAS
jgi:2-C-methyl-D-erythritol 4-phosphate cytidylyltransferase